MQRIYVTMRRRVFPSLAFCRTSSYLWKLKNSTKCSTSSVNQEPVWATQHIGSLCQNSRQTKWPAEKPVGYKATPNKVLIQHYSHHRVIERLSKHTEYDYIEGSSDSESASDIIPSHRQRRAGGKHKHTRSKSESGVSLKQQELMKKCKLTEAKLEQTEIRLQLKVWLVCFTRFSVAG